MGWWSTRWFEPQHWLDPPQQSQPGGQMQPLLPEQLNPWGTQTLTPLTRQQRHPFWQFWPPQRLSARGPAVFRRRY